MIMPGGRYGCARALQAYGLPFLEGLSLGQVCHMVHLAATQKKILGHNKGSLVPYRFSDEWQREQRASTQTAVDTGSVPVGTVSQAGNFLQELLRSSYCQNVTISNVKHLFVAHFGMELCETALGYARLRDLLNDLQFKGICTLQPQPSGHFRITQPTPQTAQ